MKNNKIIEIGHIEHGTGKHQSNLVYSVLGLSPAEYAGQYKNPYKIVVVDISKNEALKAAE